MRRTTWMLSVVTMWAMLFPPPAVAQEAVGVVTTLDGRANVARPTLTTPLALKFKDDVVGRDKISTQENSLVRVLLGGKAILTVRELSEVTITEDAGRAVVTLPDGKVVLAVAKQRMRPGESIEIRTPNAVAAVRGTIVAVAYDSPNQLTSVVCHTGECGYQFQNQTPVVLQPGMGANNGTIGPVSPDERAAAVNVASNAPHSEPGAETMALIIENGQRTAITLAGLVTGAAPPDFALGTSTANPAGVVQPAPNDGRTGVPSSFLVPPPPPAAAPTPPPAPETTLPPVTPPETTLPPVTPPETTLPPVTPPGTTLPPVPPPATPLPPVPPPGTTLPPVTPPGTTLPPGPFPAGWTLTGVGSVIGNLGSIAAPDPLIFSPQAGAVDKSLNGNFGSGMALIFTGTGPGGG